jgi:hypothetical protein
MSIENIFGSGEAVCSGISCNKPQYTRELLNLQNNWDCRKKCNEIINLLYSFNNIEKREILKSALLQIGE